MRGPIRLVPRNEIEAASLLSVMYGDGNVQIPVIQESSEIIGEGNLTSQLTSDAEPSNLARPQASVTTQNPTSSTKISKTKTAKRVANEKKKGKKISKPSQTKWRELPSELINHILSYCSKKDLLSLCTVSKAIYVHSLPLLFTNIKGLLWTDIISLRRHLESGFGPFSVSPKDVAASVAGALKDLDIDGHEHFRRNRARAFSIKETVDGLIGIIGQAKNLRSITWKSDCFDGDLEPLVKVLRESSVKILSLKELLYQRTSPLHTPDSPLWSLCTLSSIELTIPWIFHARPSHVISGLSKLVKASKCLKHLTVILANISEDRESPFQISTPNINGNALFQLEEMSQLETINLEGIVTKDPKIWKHLLTRLESVKKLRLVQLYNYDSPDYDRSIDQVLSGAKFDIAQGKLLPSLVELEMSMLQISSLLPACSPLALGPLPVALPCVEGHVSIPSIHKQMKGCKNWTSVKEMEIILCGQAVQQNRKHIVAALQCIPLSIKRLAIRLPWESRRLELTKSKGNNISLLAPFQQFENLEMVNLPWCSILHLKDNQDPDSVPHSTFEKKATRIAQELAFLCPKLEYVMFQGSRHCNANGRIAWKVDWDEEADQGKRWTLKIKRGDSSDQSGTVSGKGKAKAAGIGDVVAAAAAARKGQVVKDSIKVEILSSSCTCSSCWKEEGSSRNDDCAASTGANEGAGVTMQDMALEFVGMMAMQQMYLDTQMMAQDGTDEEEDDDDEDGPRLWNDVD